MVTIIIDVTEPRWIFRELKEIAPRGIEVERREMRHHKNIKPETRRKNPYIGLSVDYLILDDVGDIVYAMERKTFKDLVLSLMQTSKAGGRSKRIFGQMDCLLDVDSRYHMLVVEGQMPEKYNGHRNRIEGTLKWCRKRGIEVEEVYNKNQFAAMLNRLAKKIKEDEGS